VYDVPVPEADARLDLGKIGSAELDLVVGRAVQRAMAPADRITVWRALGAPLIKKVDLGGTVTAAQAGLSTPTAYFAFAAHPQTGRLWSVRKVVVTATGAGPFASALANVTAAIFVTQGGLVANNANPPPGQDADQTSFSLPTTQFYSTHQLWVRGGEWLVVGIQGSGVTTGLTLNGHARVVEIDDSPEYVMTL
jgi:hypothetical protein